MCCPCPSPHPLYTGQFVLYILYCPDYPWLCGPYVWQEHSGPVELEKSLDYQLYLVTWVHSSQKGQHPTYFSLFLVFCSWALGGTLGRALAYQLAVVSWWEPSRTVEGSSLPHIALALPLNLCLLYSGGAGLGWKKSVFEIRFYKIILLCTMPS